MRCVDSVSSAATTFPVIASRHEDGIANEFPFCLAGASQDGMLGLCRILLAFEDAGQRCRDFCTVFLIVTSDGEHLFFEGEKI